MSDHEAPPRGRTRLLDEGPLALTLAGLALGGVLRALASPGAAHVTWTAVAAVGIAVSLWSTVSSLRAGRLGVDLIALLALGGALGVHEPFAAAIIAVMLATGRALEGWAAGRARRELRALLSRAPSVAHRYDASALATVPLEDVAPGDLLMVASGEVVPVDGTVTSASAVLDESALTGEAAPVERGRGEFVRSGVVNAAGPLDLRAAARAADSTYAGVVRLVAEAELSLIHISEPTRPY